MFDRIRNDILSLLSAGTVHALAVLLVMQPFSSPPTPPEQVIWVSMVAPTLLAEKRPAEKNEYRKEAVVPEHKNGIAKRTPKKEATHAQKENSPQQQRLTTGITQENAVRLTSAVALPTTASYRHNTPPSYPEQARRRRQEGTVLLQVQVRADGTVADIALLRSSGHVLLDEAALKAVKRWEFTPARLDGEAIAVRVEVPIRFEIR